jgi:hypothetical protein
MNLREVTMKNGRLVAFISHDSAEIPGLRYELTLGISALKIMASTVFFVLLIRAFKHSISGHGRQPSAIFFFSTFKQNHSSQFVYLDIETSLGGGILARGGRRALRGLSPRSTQIPFDFGISVGGCQRDTQQGVEG